MDLLSEPEAYAESGGGVVLSGSNASVGGEEANAGAVGGDCACAGAGSSEGTGRCFMRFERRRAKPVLRGVSYLC